MHLTRWTIAFALLVIADTAALPAAADSHTTLVNGVFVGQVASRAFLALVAGDEGVRAYLCDDDEVGTWFSEAGRSGNTVRLPSTDGLETLSVVLRPGRAHGWVTYQGRRLPFTAVPARDDAGLYRAQGDIDGADYLAGWVVLNNGKQVGVVASGGLAFAAPTLSTTNLTVNLSGALISVGKVAPPGTGAGFFLDLGGDGVDLTGETQTSLFGGTPKTVRWTTPGNDDAFVATDATALRAAGYEIRNASGALLDGLQLVRDGLKVKSAGGVTTIVVDGWQMLQLFDNNGDGVLNASDLVWRSLWLFTDANADGDVDAGELKSFAGSTVASIALTGVHAVGFDALGNARADGSFKRTNGTTGLATYAVLSAP